jgi:hypothetical protein
MRLPLLILVLAATGQAWAQCKPVETQPPNAPAQQPAFEGQTRACEAESEVAFDQHLLKERGQRIRDVREGPDGALYVVTDERNGELWKIVPRR